jgi:hypothetical protein
MVGSTAPADPGRIAMFENLKSAQQAGSTARERRRMIFLAVALLATAGTFLGVRSCRTLPGTRLPDARDVARSRPEERRVDRAKLLALAPDGPQTHGAWQVEALQHVREVALLGLSDAPRPVTTRALAAEPVAEVAGTRFEVEGRLTGLTSTEFRSERERLWACVLEGSDGGQVVVVKLASASDPGQGAPTDAWPLAPVELQPGDRVLARGLYVQRRVGTVGGIALSEPTPVLLAGQFRRQVDPPADPIGHPSEASYERIDDRWFAGTARLDDPALFELLQHLTVRGHAALREDIRAGRWPSAPWGRDEFDLWSAEVSSARADMPRPFTEGARGRLFRTSGVVGKVLVEDWDALRPNAWGVNSWHVVYLMSDYYGNSVIPCLSPFSWDTFGVDDWRTQSQRVYVHGVFVKNYSFDTAKLKPEGEGAARATLPLFVIVDVEPYPMGPRQTASAVVWVLGGIVALLGTLFFLLMRLERRDEQRLREQKRQWAQKRAP